MQRKKRTGILSCMMMLMIIMGGFAAVTVPYDNIALNKMIAASSEYSTQFVRENANDGDEATIWASSTTTAPQWMYIDLGRATIINGVNLKWFDIYYPTKYFIYISADGTNWTQVLSRSKHSPGNDEIIADGTIRFIGIYMTAKNSIAYALTEFEIYKIHPTPTPTMTPTPTPTISVTPMPTDTIPVAFLINTNEERKPISDYIYGSNAELTGVAVPSIRMGGNRLTGYNWENNASNAGEDWQNSSDNYLNSYYQVPYADYDTPGAVLKTFHDRSLVNDRYSLITLPIAGYVSKDKNGTVLESETAPSTRWTQVMLDKPGPCVYPPDTTDNYCYIEELLSYLIDSYGTSPDVTAIPAYALDNEPTLWFETHPRIHPQKPTCREIIEKNSATATLIKSMNPGADVYGPALYGFSAYYDFFTAPDWSTEGTGYSWFIDYYLDMMKRASDTEGKRLLDVLDVHWYPEARGGGKRIISEGAGPDNIDNVKARIQAPRTLWDASYTEDSWIAAYFKSYLPLIPQLMHSITTYYPGTKLALTEYNYGCNYDISGGIAQADVLGILGKYGVYAANYWKMESDVSYIIPAFNIYLNYDGTGGSFGNTSVLSNTSNVPDSSIYTSITDNNDNRLHIIVINKRMDKSIHGTFTLTSGTSYTSGTVWGFDGTNTRIARKNDISSIDNNRFSYTLEPFSVYHMILE